MSPRILNLEPEGYSQQAREILQSFAILDEYQGTVEGLVEIICRYEMIIVRLGYLLDAKLLSMAKRLKVIATPTTGLNHIDINFAEKAGIKIIALKGEREFLDGIHATAELAWGLVLALLRGIPAACSHVKAYGWDRESFIGSELYGKTLGIIGFGRLGSKMAKYGQVFGMNVIVYDPHVSVLPEEVRRVSKDELVASADVISLHVPYSDENIDLINSNDFSRMKSTSYIINTSRGRIVNEAALLDALQSGRIAGAALDVLAGEIDGTGAWTLGNLLIEYARNHKNLLITPHIGGATHDSMRKTEIFIAQKLRAYWG